MWRLMLGALLGILISLSVIGCTIDLPWIDNQGGLKAVLIARSAGGDGDYVQGKPPLFVVFDSGSSIGSIASRLIKVTDPNGSELARTEEATLAITLTEPGLYTATLTLQGSNGSNATTTAYAYVEKPQAKPTIWVEGHELDLGLQVPAQLQVGDQFIITLLVRVKEEIPYYQLAVSPVGDRFILETYLEPMQVRPKPGIYVYDILARAIASGEEMVYAAVWGPGKAGKKVENRVLIEIDPR